MVKAKTSYTGFHVTDFINSYVDNEQKKIDSFSLIALMQEWFGLKPKMWGATIVGFGDYYYKYASGHEGNAPMLGFSPRKAAFSLYIFYATERNEELLPDLGKFKMGKACIYIKMLSDINLSVLKEICLESIRYLKEHYECSLNN